MPADGYQKFGGWAVPSNTQTAATVITRLIPPFRAGDGGPYLAKADGNGRAIQPKPQAYTHVTSVIYADTGTAHNVTIMRPLNWTYLTAALAANGTALTLKDDPGLYSTNFRYPLPAGHTVASTANNAIGASDYVAFQLRDGTWYFGTITSGSGTTPVLATAVPNVTGGGADANTIVYFFGIATDVVPQTGLAHHYWTAGAGTTRVELMGQGGGTFTNLNRGDPMIVYSANATAAGVLAGCAGFYADA